jgi:DnaK suppressor protein
MASKKQKTKLVIPTELLQPVKEYLSDKLSALEEKKKQLDESDPIGDTNGANDDAAIDTDASVQVGHMQVSAVRRTYDRTIIQVRKALTRIKIGNYGTCERCGQMIDTDRLMIMPETTLCVSCEKKREK